jgi:hypothetical protein
VSVTPFLRYQAFEPEQLDVMERAFRQACATLGLSDDADPFAELLAKQIVKLAQSGVRTKSALYFLTIMDFKSNPH